MDNDGDRSPEVVERSPDPLSERLAAFRTGDDRAAAGGKPGSEAEEAEEQAETETEVEETAEEEAVKEEAEEEQADEAETEDEDDSDKPAYEKAKKGAAAEGEAGEEEESEEGVAETFALDFLNVAALKDTKSPHAAVLHLEGLPQDYRDSIAAHVKRSQQLDQVSQRLDKARELETVARFYQADPLNAIRLVAFEKPELAAEFVTDWVLQNPKAALALVRQHKLDSEDSEKLELRGQLAQKKAQDALGKAYDGVRSLTAQADFMEQAAATVDELVEPLLLEDADAIVFADAAAALVQREMQTRGRFLAKTELITLLQPLVKRFAGPTDDAGGGKKLKAKPKAAAKKPTLTREEMMLKARRSSDMRRLQGGGNLQHRARPEALRKTKLPRDLGERINLLRAGKL
jgi:hypothetical protein